MSVELPAANRLTKQIEVYTKGQIALGVVVVAAIALFYIGVYRPRDQEITALNRQIASNREELSSDQSQTGRLPKVASELRDLKARLAGFKKLPPDPQLGQFIHDINQVSQRTALVGLIVEPGIPHKDQLYSEQPIVLSFKGDFPAVAAFLHQVEDMDRLTRVRDVTIRAMDTAAGTVDVSLSVDIYYAEGG